jgi:hypothetical protein
MNLILFGIVLFSLLLIHDIIITLTRAFCHTLSKEYWSFKDNPWPRILYIIVIATLIALI